MSRRTFTVSSRDRKGGRRYAQTACIDVQRPSLSPADLENLENFHVERKRFSSTSVTMIFPRLPREREFPSRDRRIAIYSIKCTADLSCGRDGINSGKRKRERERVSE